MVESIMYSNESKGKNLTSKKREIVQDSINTGYDSNFNKYLNTQIICSNFLVLGAPNRNILLEEPNFILTVKGMHLVVLWF